MKKAPTLELAQRRDTRKMGEKHNEKARAKTAKLATINPINFKLYS